LLLHTAPSTFATGSACESDELSDSATQQLNGLFRRLALAKGAGITPDVLCTYLTDLKQLTLPAQEYLLAALDAIDSAESGPAATMH
jgi:hypothetical protein